MTARSMGLLRMPQLFEPEEAARSGNDEKAVAITVSPYRSGFLDGREAGKKNIPLERGKDHIGCRRCDNFSGQVIRLELRKCG
ncbi:MAG: hypothetical protein GXY28_02230 [Bacteriovoracaceae bacterium]|nr:hypothetical protein [Bacteriovoracaceae bacterium]HRR21691.1 hypothetical protein [Desulfomonilia bacterium]HRT45995.1 hypothetical protein [Desulfomonilia bacterium]